MDVRDGDFQGGASGNLAVETLGQVLAEKEKTKRLLIGAACLFFIIAALVIVFAPIEKQNLAYLLGAALMIIALGAVGATRSKIKLPGVTIETNSNLQSTPIKDLTQNSGQFPHSQSYNPNQPPRREDNGANTML